ncbi:NAD(P)-dependent oxidoreductase [Mesorhizobium sp. BE184]|uniref:NAD-dependent epimerase/dehydratase family protein n=1 Tax=Mesorhizobium sp. BE184 TaxID=2817714 RepID=UPI0028589249|nr:NAD(P)-dependent oxidoreductase [Mesorhizobium sp. BE184]MDR7032306.1 uronate dehydrogenase [Mesorhizobium sp. BE184]
MQKHILLTGASGTLGRVVAPRLSAAGYRLRLSDVKPFPDPIPEGASFVQADLADGAAVSGIVAGADAIIHFGGISAEQPFRPVIEANILGLTHIFEAARQGGQRVVFASSNHAIGYYERGRTLDTRDPMRPDGYYGLSKAYGELLGRMMFDKHGLESVHVRIGSCLPAPTEARHLSTWLSHDDLERLLIAAIEAPETGHAIVWGVSANAASWWGEDDAARIGYVPQDDASRFGLLPEPGDAIAQRFQGGAFASDGYSRDD